MDFRSWDGTVPEKDFCVAARAFAEKWKTLNPAFPPWSWGPRQRQPRLASHEVEGFLSLEKICILSSTEDDEEPSCSEEEDPEPEDYATLVQSDHCEVHYYDFHIVYSYSFRVPVLYFRAYCSDGKPLMLDEIEKELPACSSKELLESKWTFITQEEHPYLNRPWYKLHPCGTSEWMKLLFPCDDASSVKHEDVIELYLVSWLSVVGQMVGLRIPLKMLKNHNLQLDCNRTETSCN